MTLGFCAMRRVNLIGYFLLMSAPDEAHLLNITVHGGLHGQGIGRGLLDKVVQLSRAKDMRSILLEVRPSNARALAVYLRYGFKQIGLRKAYLSGARRQTRGCDRNEVIAMRLSL